MKSHGRHRAPTTFPQAGAAALMIGGLVTVNITAASASPLTQPARDEVAAPAAPAVPASPDRVLPLAEDEKARTALGGASLSELRAQPAADRSVAREAPEQAEAAETLLEHSPFTSEAVAEVEPVVAEPEPAPQAPAAEATPEPEPAPQPATDQAVVEQAAPQPAQASVETAPVQQAPAPVGGGVLGIAAAYVGYPYVLYGTPPQSFDCSSYTWFVFQQAGISIPRTVAGQRGAVTPVSDPQPGDLVFYNDWHHVGIYAGNGMTYEALNPDTDVRYGPLLSSNVWYGRIG